ncbi:Amidase BbdA (plasmid) [Aminobacter sp. MSH1]|uniref:amidase n=1 Tax=Aminobacter sp. MSH1 TaxID=374606 RepID=UPI0006208768|nr:amidase [Aminobacter sp. MSH1]AKD43454.1 Amidase BbdA [Aminobacter sp. MSH1]
MPSGANLPSLREIRELADEFRLELSDDDVKSYQALMMGPILSTRRLEELQEFRPPVKYPRTPGYRPSAEENPYNAWYWRCRIEGAPSGILKGFDVGIKDPIGVAGVPLMNGSRMLEGYVSEVDATVVTRILDAGGTIVGKTTTEETSFSAGGHTCAYGPIRNPRKPTHSPGGSSSGSAAAIAAGDVKMAMGGDQAGSIRMPASRCGVVGLKPTYGLVPYTGAVMVEMTMDHLGPLADTVENAARLLTAVAGPDPLDPRQRGVIPENYVRDYTTAIGRGVKGLRIGVLKEGFGQKPWADLGFPGSDEIVDQKCQAAIKALEKQGAIVTEISVPMHLDGPHLWNGIGIEGPAAFMMRGNNHGTNWRGFYNTPLIDAIGRGFDSRAKDLSVQAKMVLMLGEYLRRRYHGRYYAKAQNTRHLLNAAYDRALQSCDVLALPTTPFVTPPLAAPGCSILEDMAAAMGCLANTAPFDVSGHPAITVPCGAVDDLPVGLMLVGRQFEDLVVLQAADAVEKSGDWRKK